MTYVMLYICFHMFTAGLVYPKIVGQYQDLWEDLPSHQAARLTEHRKFGWVFSLGAGWFIWLFDKEVRNASSVY